MRQQDGKRHEHVGLIARIPEHDPLIARSLRRIAFLAAGTGLPFGIQTRHALVDFLALLGDGHHHTARIGVETDFRAGIADAPQGFAHLGRHIAVPGGIHLAEHHEHARRSAHFDGHMR